MLGPGRLQITAMGSSVSLAAAVVVVALAVVVESPGKILCPQKVRDFHDFF